LRVRQIALGDHAGHDGSRLKASPQRFVAAAFGYDEPDAEADGPDPEISASGCRVFWFGEIKLIRLAPALLFDMRLIAVGLRPATCCSGTDCGAATLRNRERKGQKLLRPAAKPKRSPGRFEASQRLKRQRDVGRNRGRRIPARCPGAACVD